MEQSDLRISVFKLVLEGAHLEVWILVIDEEAAKIFVQFGRTDLGIQIL